MFGTYVEDFGVFQNVRGSASSNKRSELGTTSENMKFSSNFDQRRSVHTVGTIHYYDKMAGTTLAKMAATMTKPTNSSPISREYRVYKITGYIRDALQHYRVGIRSLNTIKDAEQSLMDRSSFILPTACVLEIVIRPRYQITNTLFSLYLRMTYLQLTYDISA